MLDIIILLKKWARSHLILLKSFISKIKLNRKPFCRIEEINPTKGTATIYCKWINSPIKLTLNEIINDRVILSNLPSQQAVWVGYYYGKYYNEHICKNHNYNKHPELDFV